MYELNVSVYTRREAKNDSATEHKVYMRRSLTHPTLGFQAKQRKRRKRGEQEEEEEESMATEK